MSPPEPRRWLHRVGYLSTVIVAFEIIAIAYDLATGVVRNWPVRSAMVEVTRTHARSLSQAPTADTLDGTAEMINKLPSLPSLGPDAVRFLAMPSFGKQGYGVALGTGKTTAEGTILSVNRIDGTTTSDLVRTFSMPLAAYRRITARLDRLSDGWPGDPGSWMDGTGVAFERARGTSVTSGTGSGPHYDQVAATMRQGLAPFVPEVAALDAYWMPLRPPPPTPGR